MDQRSSLTKAQRLSRIIYLLYHNPQGLTAAEVGRLCGISKRTALRDLRDLEELGIPLWDDGQYSPRYGVIDGYYLPPVHLSFDEALALFLAARLLARYADSFDPHIINALAKLATILPEALGRHIHATIRSFAGREEDERFGRVLSTLAAGWAGGRKVRIRHRAAGSENVHEYLFCPYFIEPSAPGYATYAIGYASYFESVVTFKVERIESAELTEEVYEIPESFNGAALIDSAWGIKYGEEAVEVALRFAPSATRRVKESVWHPTQTLEDLPDGGCLLRLEVAHPDEMLYWVRGWGPQVEALAPPELRRQLAAEAQQTAALYQGEA